MKAIIIDDESPAREMLKHLLNAEPEIELIGEAENGFEALKLINSLAPELIFLDIQMPKISGFELLELLENPPRVIFVTAYDEFALQAFEKGAIDYLLKPINPERLKKAIERVEKNYSHNTIETLSAERNKLGQALQQIVIKDGSKIAVIPSEAIDFIKAEDDYVSIATDGKKYLKKITLSKLESGLDKQVFVRVHRSYIINISRLKNIERWTKDQYMGFLISGEKITISKSGYQELKRRLDI